MRGRVPWTTQTPFALPASLSQGHPPQGMLGQCTHPTRTTQLQAKAGAGRVCGRCAGGCIIAPMPGKLPMPGIGLPTEPPPMFWGRVIEGGWVKRRSRPPFEAIWGEWWKGDGGVTEPSTCEFDGAPASMCGARPRCSGDVTWRSRGASRSMGLSRRTLRTVGTIFSLSPPYGLACTPSVW
eukprot:scaffold168730_cov26-Tisochrysis_lutea.AAC.2